MLETNKLSFSRKHNSKTVISIHDLDLNFSKQEIVSIIGQSGVGKSTIASLLSGLITRYRGSVLLDGKRVTQPASALSYVLQDYRNAVFHWLTVKENIFLGFEKPTNTNRSFTFEQVIDILSIDQDHLEMSPSKLSGGQIQKVQIARALLTGSEFIIFDEPMSSLDMKFCNDLQNIFIKLSQEYKVGIILITHNIDQAVYLSDKVFAIKLDANKKLIVEKFIGYSHKTEDLPTAHLEEEYNSLYFKIYNYLFNETEN